MLLSRPISVGSVPEMLLLLHMHMQYALRAVHSSLQNKVSAPLQSLKSGPKPQGERESVQIHQAAKRANLGWQRA